jgi:putative ABC transport system permease protein
MERLNILKSRLRALARRDAVIDEIEAEHRAHLDMEVDANVARGMSPDEAWRAALESFGSPARARELAYDVRGGGMAETLWQDLRFGFRLLRKNPSFTVIAVLTLSLGIGANTAIFSVVNGVLLQPLPYDRPEELVAIYRSPGGDRFGPVSPAAYLHLKRNNGVFADVAALSNIGWPANLTGEGDAERLQGFRVSANLFSLLGASPRLGRAFLEEEDRPGANRVVVLSHELWQRRFHADPQIVGRTLTLNGESYTVVGVMPSDFRYLAKTDVWTPMAFSATDENDRANYLELIARLKPGVSIEQAGAEADALTSESCS